MSSLSVTLTIRSAGMVVLQLRGPMRCTGLATFRAILEQALRTHRPQEVQLDLFGVVEIDADSAAAVTAVAREASRSGTRVTVVNAADSVRQRVRLAGGEEMLR